MIKAGAHPGILKEGCSGSSGRQVRKNGQTDKNSKTNKTLGGGVKPPKAHRWIRHCKCNYFPHVIHRQHNGSTGGFRGGGTPPPTPKIRLPKLDYYVSPRRGIRFVFAPVSDRSLSLSLSSICHFIPSFWNNSAC